MCVVVATSESATTATATTATVTTTTTTAAATTPATARTCIQINSIFSSKVNKKSFKINKNVFKLSSKITKNGRLGWSGAHFGGLEGSWARLRGSGGHLVNQKRKSKQKGERFDPPRARFWELLGLINPSKIDKKSITKSIIFHIDFWIDFLSIVDGF